MNKNFSYFILVIGITWGRTIAEAVSCWLPTAADRVRARVWQVGIVVDKVASGQVFLEYFGFPYKKTFIPRNAGSHL
jgi:hypothetical protein